MVPHSLIGRHHWPQTERLGRLDDLHRVVLHKTSERAADSLARDRRNQDCVMDLDVLEQDLGNEATHRVADQHHVTFNAVHHALHVGDIVTHPLPISARPTGLVMTGQVDGDDLESRVTKLAGYVVPAPRTVPRTVYEQDRRAFRHSST